MQFDYERYQQPVAEDKLGRSVIDVIIMAEKRLQVDPTAEDYEPVYDQN